MHNLRSTQVNVGIFNIFIELFQVKEMQALITLLSRKTQEELASTFQKCKCVVTFSGSTFHEQFLSVTREIIDTYQSTPLKQISE